MAKRKTTVKRRAVNFKMKVPLHDKLKKFAKARKTSATKVVEGYIERLAA